MYTNVSIADLVNTPQILDGKKVSLRGFLVVEQVFLKPTNFYLRDETGNMIRLELSNFPNQAQIIKYAGTVIEVSGLFDADKKEIQVTNLHFSVKLQKVRSQLSLINPHTHKPKPKPFARA